ncbi:DUF2756 domain-containing protein [Erwinia psidii]|uniref:DUF2756 domain-containing protein n=1 Tax=Erwinia psidii TaxID=69224 RepID=A0A3N6TR78_9GAMM|nr:DUF2756 domain-containing protein [Erwinia psidii]MCX8959502.1 DUF2756 domain-containing protein [Erwinia psidii]MCX8961894.1 DUF2756 domain-containing protein [Erwinia psidii]MCX8966528.1 DUF2756 domain-containing protein [Erwinia psidii]RQM37752.1 DUF2756 domain-containing protein [Erwinia psidii]
MMKWLLVFVALMPLSSIANMLNNGNDASQPGYNPSTQRVQQHMLIQQSQQQLKLQQDQQRQSQDLQRKVQEQRDSAAQNVLKSQPGSTYQPPVKPGNNQQPTE